MARRVGPKKVRQYSLESKLKAVKLSQLPGIEVQAVAEALDPSVQVVAVAERGPRRRLAGRVSEPKVAPVPDAHQMKQWQPLRRKYAVLEEDTSDADLLARFIREHAGV